MKKASIIVTVAATMLLAACQNTTKNKEQNTTQTSSATTETTQTKQADSSAQEKAVEAAKKYIEELYSDVIKNYRNQERDVESTPPEYILININQDETPELLLGSAKGIQAIYYLKDDVPTLVSETYVAGAGGSRVGLSLFSDGSILELSWSSGTGNGVGKVYQLTSEPRSVKEVSSMTFERMEYDLESVGLSESQEVDLSAYTWIPRPIEKTMTLMRC